MNNIKDIIESKAYDEGCSEVIIEALKNRVFVYELGIIYMKEIPIVSPFTIKLLFKQAVILGEQFDKWGLIIDLTETSRPDAITRRVINEKFLELSEKTTHTAYYTKGIILNTALRFVMFGLEAKSYSVNQSFDKVLKSVKESLK